MQRSRATPLLAGLAAILLFLGGFFHQSFGFQSLSLVALFLTGSLLLTIPLKWAVRFFFVYLGFEGLAKVISGYHPAVHVGVDLLVLALSAKVLILLILGRIRQTEEFPPLTVLFLVHVVWFLITLANPYALSLVASLAGAKVYLTMPILFFFAYFLNRHDPREMKVIMGLWIAVTLIHTFFAFQQTASGPSSVTDIHPRYSTILAKYEGFAFRPFGLTHIPGMPAIFAFLSTPFLLYFLFSQRALWIKTLLAVIIPLWSVLFFVCQVRSALLKALIGGAFFLAVYHLFSFVTLSRVAFKRAIVTTVVGLSIVASLPFLLSQVEESFPEGVRAVERTMTLFDLDKISKARSGTGDRFLRYLSMVPLGAGLSRTGAAGGKFSALAAAPDDPFGPIFFTDNFWIATLVDLGVPGMIVISLLIGLILWRGLRYLLRFKDRDRLILHAAILAGLFASAIGMYGSEAMLYNPEAAYFWYFAGCLVRLQVDHDSEARSKPREAAHG